MKSTVIIFLSCLLWIQIVFVFLDELKSDLAKILITVVAVILTSVMMTLWHKWINKKMKIKIIKSIVLSPFYLFISGTLFGIIMDTGLYCLGIQDRFFKYSGIGLVWIYMFPIFMGLSSINIYFASRIFDDKSKSAQQVDAPEPASPAR